ncbi:MAG: ROK family protein [Candidatus Odyssella sp.]|nr:ROK family protein [Candidatus Odyssella sp.]
MPGARSVPRPAAGARPALRLGVDLGGTKIEIAALGGDAREAERELLRRRVPTPRDDYAGTVAAIGALVEAAEAELGAAGTVGVGIPGSLSPATGLVRNGNSTWLNGKPLAADLERRLGRPVRLANDANCFALSEATDGAAAGAASAFGVILGTGVGGGIVIDGRLVNGAGAIAGEWGHIPLPGRAAADGPARRCWCGRLDCIETFLSGPAFEREHAAASGATLPAHEIAARAARGDAVAAASLARYADRLARGLAMAINLLDPEVIVLGGGLSNIAALRAAVPSLWAAHVFTDRVTTRLETAAHGDSSGVRGAARLWPRH